MDEFIGANVKLSSKEHMSRNRRAMLNGMARLACLSVLGHDWSQPYQTTGSPSSLYEPHKEHNIASNYKGLYGIFYKISMKFVKGENIQ